jgi:hypothetical protein
MPNSKQVSISRTEGEWNLILKKICPPQEDQLKAISRHIRREVLKVKTKLSEMPDSVIWMGGPTIVKRPYIDNAIIEDIKHIALIMDVSEQTVIDRLIITPLLQPQP